MSPALERRARWLRLRLGLTAVAVLLCGMLALDFVLVFVLPVPPQIAVLSRWDVLHFGPLVLVAAGLLAWLELRPVSRVLARARLGLRLAEPDRVRALRAVRTFPVELAGGVLGVATLGNVTTLLLDLHGRSPTVWHCLHTTIVAQSVMLPFAVVLFLDARRVLRPIAMALGRSGDPLVGGLGLRGRVGLLVTGLIATVLLVGSSYISLEQEALRRRAAARRHARVVAFLARESGAMSFEAFRARLLGTPFPDGSNAFAVSDRGEAFPSHLTGSVRRAGLRRPVVGQWVRRVLGVGRTVVARGVRFPDGTAAWVGVLGRRAPGAGVPNGAVLLALLLIVLATGVGMWVGAGVAAELRALAGGVASIVRREQRDPLPGDVGSIRETRGLVEGVNHLLAEAGRVELEKYVRAEHVLEATHTRTQMLANMSHDLRAPLTAILGFVELLRSESSGRLEQAERERMEVVVQHARELGDLLEVLLDMAKLDVGRLRLSRAWTPPATLVSRTVNGLVFLAGEAVRQELRVEVQPGLPPIYVDADLTARALVQLLVLLRSVCAEVGEEGASQRVAAFTFRVQRYAVRGDRGVELEVAGPAVSSVDPVTMDLLRGLDPEGAECSARVPRFRPGAEFARKVLLRQHARIEPFRQQGPAPPEAALEAGGAGAEPGSGGVANPASLREAATRTAAPQEASNPAEPRLGYRIRFSAATTGELPAQH